MKKIINFMLLDALSLKGGFGVKMLVVFVALSVAGYASMGIGGIFFGGVFIMSQFCINPFAQGMDGLDRFYATLSLSRKEVVIGRYFFILVIMFLVTLFYLVVGVILPLILGLGITFEHLPMMLGVYLISNFIISIFLPIFFMSGYKKARPILYLAPLTVLVIALLDNQINNGIEHSITQFLNDFNTLPSIALTLIAIFVCIIIFAVSLAVSLRLYVKREF